MIQTILDKIRNFKGIDLVLPEDPVSKNKSVTLLLVIVSFLSVLTASALESAGKIKTTSEFYNVFLACLATYVGRRMTTKSGTVINDDKKDD